VFLCHILHKIMVFYKKKQLASSDRQAWMGGKDRLSIKVGPLSRHHWLTAGPIAKAKQCKCANFYMNWTHLFVERQKHVWGGFIIIIIRAIKVGLVVQINSSKVTVLFWWWWLSCIMLWIVCVCENSIEEEHVLLYSV
jgi:hypothetical protein